MANPSSYSPILLPIRPTQRLDLHGVINNRLVVCEINLKFTTDVHKFQFISTVNQLTDPQPNW